MTVDAGLNSNTLHQGCFETMLGLGGKIPLLHHHFSRLQRGLDLLSWHCPLNLNRETVINWFKQEVDDSDSNHWRLKLSVQRTNDDLTWSITKEPTSHPSVPFTLRSVQLTHQHNTVHEQLCKLSDRVMYNSALKLAQSHGADDGLLINQEGFVSESCIAGILLVKNDRFFTPDVLSGGLRGVGLEVVKPLLISNLIPLKERSLTLDTVLEADSVWLVNALRGPFPVASIDGNPVKFSAQWHQVITELYWDRIQSLMKEETD
jgi:branched-subunit amino acid aminotransferase/4-amino-4-deoxychorismate lyase